jgi:4,5-DOPA dioxygenase extradiol
VVHNLRRIDWGRPDAGFDWARRFDDAARQAMTTSPGDVGALHGHDDFAMAVPTDEHFLPLLYLAGLADAAGSATDVLVDGCSMGSLSMTSYTLGCHDVSSHGHGGSPVLPDVPAEETNI